MRNDELAEIFDEIADMLELRDDNFYHQRAYRVAAESLRDYPTPVAELMNIRSREDLKHAVESGSIAKLRGFGPKLQERLRNLLAAEPAASKEIIQRRPIRE